MWTLDCQYFTQRISGDFLSLHDKGGWDVWVPWKICQEMQKCTVSKFPTHPSVHLSSLLHPFQSTTILEWIWNWTTLQVFHMIWKNGNRVIQGFLVFQNGENGWKWIFNGWSYKRFEDLADTIILVPYQASPISHHFSRCFPLFLGFTFQTTREKTVARPNERLRCPPADGPSFTKRSDCGARCGKVHSDVLKKGSAKIPICAFNWGNLHKSCHMAPLPF